MSRENRDQQSTAAERCDGCDRGIEQVYLNAGTSFDVWISVPLGSKRPSPNHGQYHFCGTCAFEVVAFVDEHFDADYESPMRCGFCDEPTGGISPQFIYCPHGAATPIEHSLCSSCLPTVQQFCEKIPEDQPTGDKYTPAKPRDEPFTEPRHAVFRYAKPFDQLSAGDTCVFEARQRATPNFPEQRIKLVATIDNRNYDSENSFEAPLSDIRSICGNWIGFNPTNGALELDYSAGARQLRIRFDDAFAPDNTYRSFEGHVTQVSPASEEPGRHTTS